MDARRWGLCLLVLALAAGLSGCAGAHPRTEGPRADAPVVDGYDCTAPDPAAPGVPPSPAVPGESEEPPLAPQPGAVPADFEPVLAVTCDPFGFVEDADGGWTATVATTLDGDLQPLVLALAEPSDAPWPGPCTADMEIVPDLWLIDAAGSAVHAAWPVNGCGKTKSGVREAIAGLEVIDTVTERIALVEPKAAIEAGCPAQGTAPFPQSVAILVPDPGDPSGYSTEPVPAPTTDRLDSRVDGARVCRYVVEPKLSKPDGVDVDLELGGPSGPITLQSGRFESGAQLPADLAVALVAAASAPGLAEECDEPVTRFVAVYPLLDGEPVSGALSAELDGCRRLFPSVGDPRPLPLDLLTALAG